mgnify:FL=1
MRTYRLAGTVVNSEDAVFMEAWEQDYISAKNIEKILSEAGGEEVTFNLNSGGGSVNAGSEIYTMLSSYSGRVVINITSLSASIASVFMLGADEVNISHQAQIMIHQPHFRNDEVVDKLSLERSINMLDSTEKSIAKVYMKKTGLSEDEILDMMFKETWLTSDQALELGFVDNIYNDTEESVEGVEDLVAMVSTTGEQIETLQLLNEMKGTPMNKTFFEKVKSLLENNSVENESVETVEEVVEATEEPSKADEEVEGTDTPEEVKEGSEEQSDTSEEVVEDKEEVVEEETGEVEDKTTELLTQALTEIQTLRAENEELKATVESLNKEKETLVAKSSKSQSVVNELNKLLNSEEANVLSVTQKAESKNMMPKGYTGIRSGGQI